jgi:hypothetical protein
VELHVTEWASLSVTSDGYLLGIWIKRGIEYQLGGWGRSVEIEGTSETSWVRVVTSGVLEEHIVTGGISASNGSTCGVRHLHAVPMGLVTWLVAFVRV